jgi:hypothetical protein
MGIVYGVPSFLTARVVEQGTGDPIEDALVMVIGPSLPALKETETNVGGWFNVKKFLRLPGIYLVLVFKSDYLPAIKFVVYVNEPLKETIEMKKLW